MKKLIIVMLFILGLSVLKAKAIDSDVAGIQNTLYSVPVEVAPGQLSLSISMKNRVSITGFQVDIELPAGLAFVQEDGYYVADLSFDRGVNLKTHVFNAELQEDGTLRLLCYSNTNKLFNGDDGKVATFTISIPEQVEKSMPIKLKNMVLTDASGVTIEPSEVVFTLTSNVGDTPDLKYDVNGDGKVDIADLTSLVNYLLNLE